MASLSYGNVIQSELFKFIVGQEKREFFVHSSIIACQSEPLEKLVNGNMKEAIERWDYQAAQRQTREHVRPRDPSPPQSPFSFPEGPKIRKKKISSSWGGDPVQTKDKDLWSQFKRLYPDSVSDREPEENAPEDDLTNIFLSHAHLYIFADCYDISALKLLCLQKLQRTLETFTVHKEAIDDIVQLLRFCYENTLESDEMRNFKTWPAQ
ncbi:BTB POZ fold [Fusarium heterosporum]|uniref:BTB POZ fold n=1 Tax=Fusarium heterosporum TaxID=42747 RepID=A0A8H5T2N3_FUSHE|nr:BTB POZ fold [Fusarium heterosporum]